MPGRKVEAIAARQPIDPHNINARLQNQVARLLDQLESDEGHVTMRERIQALVAIGRVQIMFVGLRKEKADEPERGSAVRKYAGAFAANDARRRKAAAGAIAAVPDEEPDILGGFADEDGDDGA